MAPVPVPVAGTLGPKQLHTAYNLPCRVGSRIMATNCPFTSPIYGGQTVAIIGWGSAPTLVSDLATFDAYSQYHLPPCTLTNGCLKVVNQTGGNTLPTVPDITGQGEQIADVEIVHEICQTCKVLVVEASSDSIEDWSGAVDEAVALGATEVTLSIGQIELPWTLALNFHFNHPGVPVVAAGGDQGFSGTPIYPAASRDVIAVGGTTLTVNADNSYRSESVWGGTGSGCSHVQLAQPWQLGVPNWASTGCLIWRSTNDVAAVAANVSIYDSRGICDNLNHCTVPGWAIGQGTSISAPLIAAVFALAGGTKSYASAQQMLYQNYSAANFHDIQSGSNGSCGGSSICSAAVGYDGPTGLGTPNGVLGFVPKAGWTIYLSSDKATLPVGSSVALTAQVNKSVATGTVIKIINQSQGSTVATCTSGSSCTASVTGASAGSRQFVAEVATTAGAVLQKSGTTTVTWNNACTTPTLSAPSNGGSLAQSTDVTISWNTNCAQSYAQLTGAPYGTLTFGGWQSGNSIDIGQMWPGTYTWQVKGRTAAGTETPWSTSWTFTVQSPPTVTEFPLPSGVNVPNSIARGPDGNVWFALHPNLHTIGRITPSGNVTLFPLPSSSIGPYGITAGPDGNIWFTEYSTLWGHGGIGRMTPTGSVSEFPVPNPYPEDHPSTPEALTVGPDGNLWFVDPYNGFIGYMTLSGAVTQFPIIPGAAAWVSDPENITVGSDGNLWFTEWSGKIGRITTSGVITEFPLPEGAAAEVLQITSGSDGNLWFSEKTGKIGRITPSGAITEFPLPLTSSPNGGIANGPDGNIWFTESGSSSRIGRMTPSGVVTEFPIPVVSAYPGDITAGGDGNLWFTDGGTNQIGKINP